VGSPETQEDRHAGGEKRGTASSSLTDYLPPVWSVIGMMLLVAVGVGGVIIVLYGIGGSSTPAAAPPVVITQQAAALAAATAATDTPTARQLSGIAEDITPDFSLTGPTLPPVFLSPTPDVIGVGRTVAVINVGESGLNVRSEPGINSSLVFTANTNSLLEVVAGPESASEDSFTWWRVRDLFTGEEGWAVQLYMEVQPESTQP